MSTGPCAAATHALGPAEPVNCPAPSEPGRARVKLRGPCIEVQSIHHGDSPIAQASILPRWRTTESRRTSRLAVLKIQSDSSLGPATNPSTLTFILLLRPGIKVEEPTWKWMNGFRIPHGGLLADRNPSEQQNVRLHPLRRSRKGRRFLAPRSREKRLPKLRKLKTTARLPCEGVIAGKALQPAGTSIPGFPIRVSEFHRIAPFLSAGYSAVSTST